MTGDGVELFSNITAANSLVAETLGLFSDGYDSGIILGYGFVPGSSGDSSADGYYSVLSSASGSLGSGLTTFTDGGVGGDIAEAVNPPLGGYVLTLVLGEGHQVFMYNYGSLNKTNDTTYPNSFNQIALRVGSVGNYEGYFQWVRTRVYPPNGIMPTARIVAIGVYSNSSGRVNPIGSKPPITSVKNSTISCQSGEAPNYFTGQCQATIMVPYSLVSNSVKAYLKTNGLGSCPITNTTSSYLGANAVEVAIVDCTGNSIFPNSMFFFLNSTGNIIEVQQTG